MMRDLIEQGWDTLMSSAPTAEDTVTNLNALSGNTGANRKPTHRVYGRGHNGWNIATFVTVITFIIGVLVYYTAFVRSDESKENRLSTVETKVVKIQMKQEQIDEKVDSLVTTSAVQQAEQRSLINTAERIERKLDQKTSQ